MSRPPFRNLDEIEAELAARDPRSEEEKTTGRARAKAATEAYILGYELSEMRKAIGFTQTQVAEAMGVSQARISKIEGGDISGIEVTRAYVTALGGTLRVTATVGDRTWRVA